MESKDEKWEDSILRKLKELNKYIEGATAALSEPQLMGERASISGKGNIINHTTYSCATTPIIGDAGQQRKVVEVIEILQFGGHRIVFNSN